VYRGGNLPSGWIYAGLDALGMTIGGIALVAAPPHEPHSFQGRHVPRPPLKRLL
jgi:hypothetical protein